MFAKELIILQFTYKIDFEFKAMKAKAELLPQFEKINSRKQIIRLIHILI